MAGGRVLPPYASPRAPCQRTRREAIDEDRLAVASRRRARAVVQGARLRKRRTTVFASRVAQVVRVPRVVFSTVVVVGCHPRRCGGRRGGRSGAAGESWGGIIVGNWAGFGLVSGG